MKLFGCIPIKQKKTIKDLASSYTSWDDECDCLKETNSWKLLLWLNSSAMMNNVKDYNQFCALENEIKAQGYKVLSSISESDFNREILKPPARPPILTMEYYASSYDFWRKKYVHPKRSDTESLLEWLNNDYLSIYGSNEINSYYQFCELAKEVAALGYSINTSISEDDFYASFSKIKQINQRR